MTSNPSFDNDSAVIFLLDRDDRLVGCNANWNRFALANGGEAATTARMLGSPLFRVVPDHLEPFYRNGFRLVREHKREWSHVYDCSSPSQLRRFHMRVLPSDDNGLIVVNDLLIEREHERHENGPLGDYVGASGLVRMCSHCRRTLNLARQTWDWVPDFVERQPIMASHGLCLFCRFCHYPELQFRN